MEKRGMVTQWGSRDKRNNRREEKRQKGWMIDGLTKGKEICMRAREVEERTKVKTRREARMSIDNLRVWYWTLLQGSVERGRTTTGRTLSHTVSQYTLSNNKQLSTHTGPEAGIHIIIIFFLTHTYTHSGFLRSLLPPCFHLSSAQRRLIPIIHILPPSSTWSTCFSTCYILPVKIPNPPPCMEKEGMLACGSKFCVLT